MGERERRALELLVQATEKMVVSLKEIKTTGAEAGLGEESDNKFCFRQAELEVPRGHSGTNIQWTAAKLERVWG